MLPREATGDRSSFAVGDTAASAAGSAPRYAGPRAASLDTSRDTQRRLAASAVDCGVGLVTAPRDGLGEYYTAGSTIHTCLYWNVPCWGHQLWDINCRMCVCVCVSVCLSADISLYCAKNDSTDYPEIVWVCWV